VLGRFVRDQKRLDLVDALRRMTLMPAERLRLKHKGRIEPGCDADITVFDPASIIDKADYTNPTRAPQGILMVLIGGAIAWDPARSIRRRLGKAIRRQEIKGWV
jgi:N-acyl-D-aspartate/D-glutamate deacylase